MLKMLQPYTLQQSHINLRSVLLVHHPPFYAVAIVVLVMSVQGRSKILNAVSDHHLINFEDIDLEMQ